VNAKDDHQEAPLNIACRWSGNVSIVRELLENGGDLNAKGRWRFTPLLSACYFGKGEFVVEILKFLSERLSRDAFQSELKNVREGWNEKAGGIPISSVLNEELMASFEYNLSTNRENNEKGAR